MPEKTTESPKSHHTVMTQAPLCSHSQIYHTATGRPGPGTLGAALRDGAKETRDEARAT